MLTSSSDGDIAIRAEGLGKQYLLGAQQRGANSLRDVVANAFSSGAKASRQTFWALDDVSFEIRHGENVGILGLNGAGKSTLLKILSRVTQPTKGEAFVRGRLGCLLEVGTGFHGELTGRENIFLYGAILGMSKAEVARKFDAIVAFAEIGDFIGTPVKRYSSGMYVRLAFSVAAHLEPDILLLDEVLSVGDLPFQRKCIDFVKDLQKRQATILFVSHNMFSIKTMCDRVIYIRKGRVQFDGPTERGIALYEADCRLSAVPWARAAGIIDAENTPIVITEVAMLDQAGAARSVFDHGEPMRLRIDYEIREPLDDPNLIVAFIRSDGVVCCNYSTALDGVAIDSKPGRGRIELVTPPLTLISELYKIEILVREKGFQALVCGQHGGSFHVRDPVLDMHFGVFHEAGAWTLDGAERPASVQPNIGVVA
ncbi:ABC transporter ATP-binding protein [Caulobacter segnis]